MATIAPAQLKPYAYYRTGGKCDLLCLPESIEELVEQVKSIHAKKQKFFLLGGGTNSLVWDDPYPGAVIVFSKLNRLQREKNKITAGAGVDNSEFAKFCLQEELTGAAWMYRLPGQLGATTRMNARCYGGEISQIVTKLQCVTPTGERKTYTNPKEIFRGYKDTIFMTNHEIIAEIEVTLEKGDPKAIQQKMQFCEKDRVSKDQFVYPTCGCVFKNDYDVGVPSGMLLEQAGVKAFKHNGCTINPKHANFVYNIAATARDILQMTFMMREAVYDKFGVWMEYEMEILGELPKDFAQKIKEKRKAKWNEKELVKLRAQFAGATAKTIS